MKKNTIIGTMTGLITGVITGVAIKELASNHLKKNDSVSKVDKFKEYYYMMNEWLRIKQEGGSIEKYLLDNGFNCIAIYGMGEVGNRLYMELKNSSIEVKYAIDKNAGYVDDDLEIMDIDNEFDDVDAIIVTPVFAFKDIMEDIEDNAKCPIISLEDVIYEVLNN